MPEVRQIPDWTQLTTLGMVLAATVVLGLANKVEGSTLTVVLGAAIGAATSSTNRRQTRSGDRRDDTPADSTVVLP
jgi:hypothetical protein